MGWVLIHTQKKLQFRISKALEVQRLLDGHDLNFFYKLYKLEEL